MNHVYQIYLSNWYLCYYYSFLGEHLILADLIRWRWTKPHSDGPVYTDSTVPITRGCSYLLDVSTDKVALIRHRTLNIIIWRQMGPPAFFKIYYVLLKRVKSTDESWRQTTNISRRKTTKKGCQRWYVFLKQKETSGSLIICIQYCDILFW